LCEKDIKAKGHSVLPQECFLRGLDQVMSSVCSHQNQGHLSRRVVILLPVSFLPWVLYYFQDDGFQNITISYLESVFNKENSGVEKESKTGFKDLLCLRC
jgi:hypothetical protein